MPTDNVIVRFVMATLIPLMTAASSTVEAAAAPGYPVKNISVIVGYPPGGGTDLFARAIAQDLGRQFERQIIVDNRSGAAGNIGAEYVVKAAPDGYTLLYAPSPIALSKLLTKNLSFDAQRDLKPISMTISIPLVLVVHPSLPVQDVKGLIALAKSKPGTLTYSSSGIGNTGHFSMVLLNMAVGIDTRHVPYRGAAPSLTSVISGETQMAFLVPPLVRPHANSGKLRLLAVSSLKRSSALSNLPTMQEQGVRDFEALQWHGFFAPAATPDPVITTLHGSVLKALAKPELKSALIAEGAEIVGSSPAAFAAFFEEEVVKWAKVAKLAGVQPE